MNSFKINSNTYAMDALRQLNAVNNKVAMHQVRLSTGKRINNAQDDAAAYAVIQKTIARMEALDVSKDNIQNAKASLQLVEQGQMKQLEILQSIKQKVLQLQDATLTSSQRQSIVNSINSMKEEIVDIGSKLNINGTNLAGQKTVSISSAITKIGSDLDGDAAGDSFGKAISLSNDGKIMAVGAPADEGGSSSAGSVKIFKYENNQWSQLGNKIEGSNSGDAFGNSVDLNSGGNTLAVGSIYNDDNGFNSGQVRVFQLSGSSWSQVGSNINGESTDDNFGDSVSLNSAGNRLAVGGHQNDGGGSNAGHVRVFENNNGSWNQLGSDIDGEGSGDRFGGSVVLSSDGNRLAAGSVEGGYVKIYEYSNGSWSQLGNNITGSSSQFFGVSIDMNDNGTQVIVGAPYGGSGRSRVYTYSNGTWTQLGSDLNGLSNSDNFGAEVTMDGDGNKVAVGANQDNSNGARVFEYSNGAWNQVGDSIQAENTGDGAGSSVALSRDGSTIAVGAKGNDDNGTDSGHVRAFSIATEGLSSTEGITTNFNTGSLVSDTFEYNGFAYTNTSSLSIDIDSNNVADSNDLDQVQSYINQIISSIQKTGSALERLDHKLESANDHFTAHEAVRSSFEDADFAEEQMELIKAQIMQQTAIAALSQANTAPQIVLSLFQS